MIADYKDTTEGKYTLLLIKYDNENVAQTVYTKLATDLDPYLKILEQYDKGFIFKDFQDKFGLVDLCGDSIKIKIKLKSKPALVKN